MIALVPAPLRQFKTYTMLLGIAIGSFDALLALIEAFGDLQVMSHSAVLVTNAVLAFLIVPAKLIAQSVPATAAEKIELVQAAAAQPLKSTEPTDVSVHVFESASPTAQVTIHKEPTS